MAKPTLKVEGTQQVVTALNQVRAGISDLSETHQREADALLGDVRSLSRWNTGALAMGWEPGSRPDAAEFTNRLRYSTVQEFGYAPHNIEPTEAVAQAFDRNQSRTEQIYNAGIAAIADKANIETR